MKRVKHPPSRIDGANQVTKIRNAGVAFMDEKFRDLYIFMIDINFHYAIWAPERRGCWEELRKIELTSTLRSYFLLTGIFEVRLG